MALKTLCRGESSYFMRSDTAPVRAPGKPAR